jgi:hypothetical protein
MKTFNLPMLGWLGLTLRDGLLCFVLLFLTAQQTFSQSLNYSTTVNSTSGPNYSVTVALELTAIVPVQNTCQWGYNYDVGYNYAIQINGSSSSLYTLAGHLTCGANSGIYFDLPNNGGSGSASTQGNPWTNNTDCATATLQSMQCASIDLQIEGPGIPMQTITLTPTSGGNGGGGTDWCMNGNNADSTNFIGTTNTNPLNIRTNNEERMRITTDGNVGIGLLNPNERLSVNGNIALTGDIHFMNYLNEVDTSTRLIGINAFGKTKPIGIDFFQQKMYGMMVPDMIGCANGVLANPIWTNSPGVLFTGHLNNCPAKVGIGTAMPSRELEVVGMIKTLGGIEIGNPSLSESMINCYSYSNQLEKLLSLGTKPFNGSEKPVLELNTNGEFSLYHEGAGSPFTIFDENQFKLLQLDNTGLLRSRKIRIDLDNWADFVFEENYERMTLGELKIFIQKEKHLPGVPNEKSVKEEGIDLGEMNRILLQKIEELTLYVIELNEEVEKLKSSSKK